MPVHKIKDYKLIKDENGNKIKVKKTKKEWDKQTCKGTKIYYFENRYDLPNGQRKKYISKNYTLKREAEDEERKFLNNPLEYIAKVKNKNIEVLINECNDENKIKRSLNDVWLEMIENIKDKESTIYSHESCYNVHIKEYFENLNKNIEEISKQDIKNWQKHIEEKRTNIKKPYKISYKKKMFTILSIIFEYACDEEYIEINIIERVKNFQDVNDISENDEIRYQTLEQFYQFISVVNDILWRAFFDFTFWHGPRAGEEQASFWKNIINLDKWDNVDNWEDIGVIDDLKIIIHETFSSKVRGGGHKITNTKNRKKRIIPIAPQAQESLFNLYKFYSKLDGFSKDWFIFGGIRHISMSTMRRRMEKYYDEVDKMYYSNTGKKVNRLTHHEFGRHSIASHLRNRGAKPEDVAEYLGDTVEVIEKTYYHSYTEERLSRIKNIL